MNQIPKVFGDPIPPLPLSANPPLLIGAGELTAKLIYSKLRQDLMEKSSSDAPQLSASKFPDGWRLTVRN
jgi:hypothetical protein